MEATKVYIINFIKNFGTDLLESILVLLLGIVIIRLVVRIIQSIFFRTKVDGTAVSFVLSLVRAVLGLVLFFLIMKIFGIDTSSIVAVVAASGLAVGLALQDSLSNLASGILLLVTKPFKENQYVKIGSVEGVVKKIKITTTELLTADNLAIIVPNGKVVTSEIINYSAKPTRRLDLVVGVAYGSDVDKVKALLQELADGDERIIGTPAPVVMITALADSAVQYTTRVWVSQNDFWSVKNGYCEAVLKIFAKNGIEIPYNKLDVFVKEVGNDK